MSESDETFLQRWSRRKTEVRQGPPAGDAGIGEVVPDGDAATRETDVAALDPAARRADHSASHSRNDLPSVAKPLTEEDFADVDFSKLDYGSDYSRFMANGVPESIRQKALGQLWHSDPIFTQVDPFQDYAGDYTDAAVAVPGGLIKTAYKIGQGFLSDEEAAEWDKLGKPQPGDAAPIVGGDVTLALEDPDQPEVRALLVASDTYMASLYPAESNHLVDVAALQQPDVRFFVARHDAQAVGCGAILLAGEGRAEIKRMWVDPTARGLRLGARLLERLELAARQAGCHVLQLETGISQPEALALYRKAGFTEIAPFGDYKPDPLSLFMEKALP